MEIIKEAMKKLRHSQKTLAEEIGVSSKTVSNWFTKKHTPRERDIKMISEILGLELKLVENDFPKKGKEREDEIEWN